MLHFLCLLLCLLAPHLNTEPNTSAEQTTLVAGATLQDAQKKIRALASIKEAIESSLLESESGLWPRSDELFKATAQLIILCYNQKQPLNTLHARVYLATLEDYIGSLSQQESHVLARSTPAVKQLTTKALREITTTTKTPLQDATPEAQAETAAFELTIKKTIRFIKNQFLPPEPILPREETLVERVKKKGRNAYNYVAETIEENPFASGVVIAGAVCGTIYLINKRYFSNAESGLGSGRKSIPRRNQPPPNVKLDINATCASISSPHQIDGKSCGYHSAENALAFAESLAAATQAKGSKLSAKEIEDTLKAMKWPARETIQDEHKAAFLESLRDKMQELSSSESTHQIATLEKLANDGGWIDGEAVAKFVHFLQERNEADAPVVVFQDSDETNGLHWDLYEVGTESEGPASLESRMRSILTNTKKLLAAIKDQTVTVDGLKDTMAAQKTVTDSKGVKGYAQDTLKLQIAGDLTLADILELKEVLPSETKGKDKKPIGYRNSPVFFRFLQAFHKGFPLILNWRQPGHWTCNIVIPVVSTNSTEPLKAKGFVVDSYGSSQPWQFKKFLNFLVQKKPLTPEETEVLRSVFAPTPA